MRLFQFRRVSRAAWLAAARLPAMGAVYGCDIKPRVSFTETCYIYAEPNIGTRVVGKTRPGREYEVIEQRQDWYRIDVYEARTLGWTRCQAK